MCGFDFERLKIDGLRWKILNIKIEYEGNKKFVVFFFKDVFYFMVVVSEYYSW